MFPFLTICCAIAIVALSGVIYEALYKRNMRRWMMPYVFPDERKVKWDPEGEFDIFIAICDHWEPECYGASHEEAVRRVHRWRDDYPRLFEKFRDVNGRPPQYSFFYPQDEYHPRYLDDLKPLIDAGFGDVEVHLHHHADTAEQLREKLDSFRETLFHQHGLLRRDPETGEIIYGFIHGNWALCNSHPQGLFCGVNEEIKVLLETGCYADFTLPSAPSVTQIQTINSIYYAKDHPGESASHGTGVRARVGQAAPNDHLLMIQGPLGLDWSDRKYRLVPRIENGDVHGARAASWQRMKMWLNAGVYVAGRSNWRFVKLYAHGCKQENIDTLLGPKMQQFYQQLTGFAAEHPNFRLHFVTAYEMAQLVHQAEQGIEQPQIVKPEPLREERKSLNTRVTT